MPQDLAGALAKPGWKRHSGFRGLPGGDVQVDELSVHVQRGGQTGAAGLKFVEQLVPGAALRCKYFSQR